MGEAMGKKPTQVLEALHGEKPWAGEGEMPNAMSSNIPAGGAEGESTLQPNGVGGVEHDARD